MKIKELITKKRIRLFTWTISIALVAFFFRHAFLGYSSSILLHYFFPLNSQYQVEFDKVRFVERGLLFEKFEIRERMQGDDPPSVHVSIPRFSIKFEVSFRHFDIHPKVILYEPKILLRPSSKSHPIGYSPSFFRVSKQSHIEIDRGHISWLDDQDMASMFISFQQTSDPTNFGVLSIADSPYSLQDSPIQLSFSQLGGELLCHSSFSDVSLPWLFRLLNTSHVISQGKLKGKEGLIDGQMLFVFNSRGDIERADGSLEWKKSIFFSSLFDATMNFDQLSVDFSYPKFVDKSLVDQPWWSKLKWKSDLKNFHITLPDNTTCALQGSLQVGYKASNYLSLKGILKQQQQESLIRIKGVPCIDSTHLLSAEVLFRDVKSREADSIIDISLAQLEPGSLQWEAHLDQISDTFFLALNPFLSRKSIRVEDGYLHGSLRGEWGKDHRYSIEAEGLTVEKLMVKSGIGETKIESALCHGRVVFSHQSVIPYFYLAADHLDHLSYDKPIPSVHSTFVKCQVIDNQFKDCYIMGKVGEGSLETRWKGSLDNPRIHLDLQMPTVSLEEILHSFIQEIKIEPIQNLSLHLDVAKGISSWSCEGHIGVVKQDNKEERIDLNAQLSDDFYKKIFLKPQEMLMAASFKGEDISSCIYQVPIDILGMDFKLFGSLDIQGRIDNKDLVVNFSSNHLLFDSKEVEVELRKDIALVPVTGRIHFPFAEEKFYVSMPITKASCLFKPKKLRFENIDGKLDVKGDDLYLQDLVGNSKEGIDLRANIYLHFTGVNPDFFDLHVTHFQGYLSQILEFCGHFPEFPPISVETNGWVTSDKKGLRLQSPLNPEPPLPDWSVSFSIRDGFVEYGFLPSLKDVCLKGEWDSTRQRILVEEVHADIENPASHKRHHLYIPTFSSEGLSNAFFTYDIRLENELSNPIFLVGTGTKEEMSFAFDIDLDSSHFFGMTFEQAGASYDLVSEEWGIDINAQMNLACLESLALVYEDFTSHTLPSDWKRYFQGSSQLIAKWDSFEDSGHFSLSNPSIRIDLNKPSFDPVHGSILLGNYEGQFEMIFSSHELTINNLIARYFDAKLSVPRASLIFSEKLLRIPSFTLDLDRNFLPEMMLKWGLPLESIQTKGSLQIKTGFAGKDFQMDALLSMEMFDKEREWIAKTLTPFTFQLRQNFSWQLEDFKLGVSHLSAKDQKSVMSVNKVEGLTNKDFLAHSVCFSLDPVVNQKIFSQPWLNPLRGPLEALQEWLIQNPLSFSFDLQKQGSFTKLSHLQQKGLSWVDSLFWKMKDAEITISPDLFFGKALISNSDKNISLEMSYEMDQLHLDVYDVEKVDEKLSLVLTSDPKQGIKVDSIKGSALGLTLYFVPKYSPSQEMIVLTGKSSFDFAQIAPYLPHSLQETLASLEIGKGYEIFGDIVIPLPQWKKPYFEGCVKGRDFEVLGYALRNVMAGIRASFSGVECKDLRLSDEGVVVWIDEASLSFNEPYMMEVGKIELNDFRPSLIFKRSVRSKKMKPFVITHATVQGLKGPLQHLEKIRGTGDLKFINTSKREYTIFDFPLELISRLGLDMKLLVPIKGQIDFVIENEKLIFKDLKDSISEGKRSHFILSRKHPSYIDFNGNMHIDIKMKQHVLLKLTQPFTLSIRGNLIQPQFSLK